MTVKRTPFFPMWLMLTAPAFTAFSLSSTLFGLLREVHSEDLGRLISNAVLLMLSAAVAALLLRVLLDPYSTRYCVSMARHGLALWTRVVPYLTLGTVIPVPILMLSADAGLRYFYTLASAFVLINCLTVVIGFLHYIRTTRQPV